MSDTGSEDVGPATHAAERETEFPAEFVQVLAATVFEFDALEVIPDALVRVEVGSIGGQAFEVEPLRCTAAEEVFDGLSAMDGRAVPDHHEPTRDLT